VSVWGPLGEVLDNEPSIQNRANVAALTEHAAGLLTVVRDTLRRTRCTTSSTR